MPVTFLWSRGSEIFSKQHANIDARKIDNPQAANTS